MVERESLQIDLIPGKGRDQIRILGSREGLRALAGMFRDLASQKVREAVVSPRPGVSCRRPITLRARVLPEPSRGQGVPMLVRALKLVVRPEPRRGLFRVDPAQGPVFEWVLDSTYWDDFAERVAGLADSPRENYVQCLDSDLPQDACVEVEYRERLTPSTPGGVSG